MSRLTRLITFVALCLVLAACGTSPSSSEVTTTDLEAEEVVAASEGDIEVSAGSVEDDVQDDDEQSSAVEAPVPPAAPAVSSPAGRQDAQAVGGVEPEVVPAAESNATTEAEAEDAIASEQSEQAPPAAAPAGPVVDVPVFPTFSGDSNDDSGDFAAPSSPSLTDARPVPDLASDSCGSACEIGGVDTALDAAALEPDFFAPEPEANPNIAELAPDLDEICPEGSGADCVVEVEDVAAGDASADGEEVVDEPTCEARPWMVGCDGPVPEPGDFEPQEIVQEVNDGSTGVQVPQEIQDALLAPIDE